MHEKTITNFFSQFAILFLILVGSAYPDSKVCSRVAVVEGQEILVDSSTQKPGEGLRFYLEKDPEAKKLLDKYQSRSKMKWTDALLSTTGSGLILGGLFQTGDDDKSRANRKTLFLSGAGLIALSYLISTSLKFYHEKYLIRSIEEYNKRNTPQIYFSPLDTAEAQTLTPNNSETFAWKMGLGLSLNF